MLAAQMKTSALYLSLLIILLSCKEEAEPQFSAGEVIVATKAESSMEQVFEFINSQDNSVEKITSATYVSSLPPDSLASILKYLNQKTYTHGDNLLTTGQINSPSGEIHIFPRLYQMNEVSNQQDWIASMQKLKCKEKAWQKILLIHVPQGSEKDWVKEYQSHAIVETAELNYIWEVSR